MSLKPGLLLNIIKYITKKSSLPIFLILGLLLLLKWLTLLISKYTNLKVVKRSLTIPTCDEPWLYYGSNQSTNINYDDYSVFDYLFSPTIWTHDDVKDELLNKQNLDSTICSPCPLGKKPASICNDGILDTCVSCSEDEIQMTIHH